MNCLQCSSPILQGRADRKFCSIDCKNEYHNAYKTREHAELKKISQILKKNRRILKTVCDGETEIVISKNELLQQGFDFNFHTQIGVTVNNNTYTLCYDYGYIDGGNDTVTIVKGPIDVKNS